MYKRILFCILFLSFIKNYSQELSVPYQLLDGVPIVNVSVDGKNHQFIFDTGAYKTAINPDVFPNLPILTTIDNVGGISSERKPMDVVNFSFEFLGKIFKNYKVGYMNKVFNLATQYSCDGLVLDGIIGRDIMEGYIIEINPSIQKISFHNASQFNKEKISDFTKIKLRNSSAPIVPVTIGNQKRYVVFDTGSSGELSVSSFRLDKYINGAPHTAYTTKGNSIAVHGINNDTDIHHRIHNSTIKMWELTVKNQRIETSANDFNNMGFGFIDQFISYLDMKGKTLYVKQVSENTYVENILESLGFYSKYNTEKKKNIVTMLALKNAKLKLEDAILNINGEELPVDNCSTYSFLRKFVGVPLKMTIEREGKIIQVEQPVYNEKY